jgi:hypothetical protein
MLMLTHVGLKRLQALSAAGRSPSPDEASLVQLGRSESTELHEGQVRALLERGWGRVAPPTSSSEAIRLQYERNPLEHVTTLKTLGDTPDGVARRPRPRLSAVAPSCTSTWVLR